MLSNLLVRCSVRSALARRDAWCIAERHLSNKGGAGNDGGTSTRSPPFGSTHGKDSDGGVDGAKVGGSASKGDDDLFSKENTR